MAIIFKQSTHGLTSVPNRLTYGNNRWYAATVTQLAYSIDKGATWTIMSDLPVTTIYSICHGNGRLVMFGVNSAGNGINAILPDGSSTWQTQTVATTYHNVVWCKERFIATELNASGYATSTDGLNWTVTAFGENIYYNTVSFVNGIVAIFARAGGTGFISYNNGASFTKITTAPDISSIVYGAGYYFGFKYHEGTTQYAYRSADLVTWEQITMPWPEAFRAVAFVDGQFVAPAATQKMYVSSDGSTWTTQSLNYYASHTLMNEGGVLMMFPSGFDAVLYYVYNNAPTAPGSITVPTGINGGTNISISWAAAADADSNLSGYILERSVNNGNWAEIYKGALRNYTDAITFGWASVQYRVKAYDAYNAESAYTTSETRTVNNNTAPTISGSDGNLGSFSDAFTAQSYTVNDAEGGRVTVVERVDGTVKRTYTATLGTAASVSFTAAEWRQILNGPHTITITATDNQGLSTVRTWTFTKAMNTLTFTITPLPADAMPDRCVVAAAGNFPTGSTLKIEVCNNANDASPTWEDVSGKLGQKHFFTNAAKTAAAWAFGLRCTLTRGTATGAVWLDYITINYR